MVRRSKILSMLKARSGTGEKRLPDDPHAAARQRITDYLLDHCLIGSYHDFRRHGKSYPFVDPVELFPAAASPAEEHIHQNTAFILLLDGVVPSHLTRHFRLRGSNRVTWQNIRRLAPGADVETFKAGQCLMHAPDAEVLLDMLVGLDYALLIDRVPVTDGAAGGDDGACRLSHMHVKVERLIDSAIKDMGKSLGYIERRLFERGEDYVDALESKFFEYYGFPPQASGRKSAAAMAAQLLSKLDIRFAVLVANQDDRRLTILDDGDQVTQYMLLRPSPEETRRMARAAVAHGAGAWSDFTLSGGPDDEPVVIHRVCFGHTKAARAGRRAPGDSRLTDPWLEIRDQAVIPPPRRRARGVTEFPFSWPSPTVQERSE